MIAVCFAKIFKRPVSVYKAQTNPLSQNRRNYKFSVPDGTQAAKLRCDGFPRLRSRTEWKKCHAVSLSITLSLTFHKLL
jgi:hypothetical protein